MAHDPNRMRGVHRKKKRPDTMPFDRGRLTSLEGEMESVQTELEAHFGS